MKKLILIGDSIRMGYEATVRNELANVAEVASPQDNGGDSRNVLRHLNDWVLSQMPDAVHLNCGLHDLRREFGSPDPQVPIEEYEANLREILQKLKQAAPGKVMWATTTPVNGQRHHETKGFDRWEQDVQAYNAAALRVAGELGIQINDLYRVVNEAGPDRLLTADGVHFEPQGSELLGKAVAAAIKPMLA
jgi:lysophospholipase L1-like esterase